MAFGEIGIRVEAEGAGMSVVGVEKMVRKVRCEGIEAAAGL